MQVLNNKLSVSELLMKDSSCLEKEVVLFGWIRTRRDSKAGFSFLAISDGSSPDLIQVVANQDLDNYQNEILKLTAGCSVKVIGKVVESKGRGQKYEIHASSVALIGEVEDPDTYPISPKKHTFEYLREVAHLRPRTNTFGSIARIRHSLSIAIHEWFDKNGFFWVHTPIITGSDCEGAGEMFKVSTLDFLNLPKNSEGNIEFEKDFFGKEAGLTVSGQLNVESYCCALSKVYTFGPTFRAENSNTSRHLAEFWMIEPEIAFADLSDNVNLAESFLKGIIKYLLERSIGDLSFFNKRIDNNCLPRLENLANSKFETINYTDAIAILEKSGEKFQYPVSWGIDLQSEHERWLTEKYVEGPIVVTNYPKDIKAFYMRLNDDNKTVSAMDILVPGIGEIIGGAQREERVDVLLSRMKQSDLDINEYSWYVDLRRYGTVPHSGFGLGFERLIQYVTGMSNIRDVIPFPRTPRNCEY